MSLKKFGAALAAAALAVSMSACASGTGGTDLSNLRIGIKFDQPGMGLKEGENYTGFDVDVATYIAGKLGTTPDKIQWMQAPTPQRETLISSNQVDLVVDHERTQGEGVLRRPLLRRRPGPAGPRR